MLIPVVISPSSQPWNNCVVCGSEEKHCRNIGEELQKILLKDNRFVVGLCPVLTGSESERLTKAVQFSDSFITSITNKTHQGYHLALHTDAFDNKSFGCSCFHFGSPAGIQAATAIFDELSKLTPWADRALKEDKTLYEIRKPLAISILIEYSFHDNAQQAKWIHDNIYNLAYSTYLGLLKANNLELLVDDDWQVQAVKKCLELGILNDKTWINKAKENVTVGVVAQMFVNYIAKNKQ